MGKENKKAPIIWLWEFSKRVVTTSFVLYVIAVIYTLAMIYRAITCTMDTTALSTFVTEMNETFRIVVGGYMLKAAGENIVKITTAYLGEKGNAQNKSEEKIEESGKG